MFTLDTFYKSKEWEEFRKEVILERVNEEGLIICEHCGEPILHKYDCIGHHKIELTPANVNDFNISLNKDNIELIHFKCHNYIHKRFIGLSKADKKVYIVYGSPCSGKSTFVRENREKGDLVVDIDRIWEALSYEDAYVKPNTIKSNVLDLHNHLLEQVKMRLGNWNTAWIVTGVPRVMDRIRLQNELGAELIYIEATKEECISNLYKDPRRIDVVKEWEGYIDDWFRLYNG